MTKFNKDIAANAAVNDAAAPPKSRMLRQPEVLARIGVSWMTLRRWEDAGLFPRRIKLGPNSVAWRECDIDEWCASRKTKFVAVAR